MKLLTAILAASVAAGPVVVHAPAEAIRMAAAAPGGKSGRFEMKVAATGVTPNGTFLNSTADYRADDNLTFRLSPKVAQIIAQRYGAAADAYLRGKHVVVDGRVRNQAIATTVAGRPRNLARWQHEVDVDSFGQIVSMD